VPARGNPVSGSGQGEEQSAKHTLNLRYSGAVSRNLVKNTIAV
jgi:hypothetical protein